MNIKTPPERSRGSCSAPGANPLRGLLREVLGHAHYERMRNGMDPDLVIPPWAELPNASREAYRRRLDYVVPTLLAAVDRLRTEARDEAHTDLLDEEIVS